MFTLDDSATFTADAVNSVSFTVCNKVESKGVEVREVGGGGMPQWTLIQEAVVMYQHYISHRAK